jgi:DNA primase
MAIPDEDVAQVRAATDLVALVGERVALRRQGRRFVGLCPFHQEKTPSFSVNPEAGVYYCFGCHASGDAISFLRHTEHLEFAEAVERLAERAGLPLRRSGPVARRRRQPVLEALEKAVAFYHAQLLEAEDARPARDYLRSRGYGGEVVRRFRLGWAPEGWDRLVRALELPTEVLLEAGLASIGRNGRPLDAFRGRVVFPIFDVAGRPVALGGRVLPGAAGPPAPKYVNSKETSVYSKSRTLYGLNFAKAAIAEAGEVVVCEGYTDVIGLFLAGVPHAVATCGTALGEEHVKLLRGFTRRIVLAYDADAAGQAAAERFYQWERHYDLDLRVAELPPGSDPADRAREDPASLVRAIRDARPYLAFRLERLLRGADLATAEGRARAAEAAVGLVAEHPSELVRDQYAVTVADRCRVDPDRVRALVQRARAHPAPSPPGSRPGGGGVEAPPAGRPGRGPTPEGAGSASSGTARASSGTASGKAPPVRAAAGGAGWAGTGPGAEALRLAVHRPEAVADRLEEVLFSDPLERAAFRCLAAASTLHEAIAAAPPEVAEVLARVAVEEAEADPEDVVIQLARLAGRRVLGRLEALARSDEAADVADLARTTRWLRLTLEDLNDPGGRGEAATRLVAFLVELGEEGG